MNDNLPEGWVLTTVGNLTTVVRGASPRPKGDPRYFGGVIPWIMISDITRQRGKFLASTRDHVTEEGAQLSRRLPAGSLILSNSGSVCIPKVLAVEGCIHDGFLAFPDLAQSVSRDFAFWWFEYIRPAVINEHRQGNTQVNLNTDIARNLGFALPPRNEQDRIVEKLEAVLEKVQSSQEMLDRVSAVLRRFRQAALGAACNGKLTADWRAARGLEVGDELPGGWREVCVGDVIDDLKYGTAQKCTPEKRGTPVLRIPNVAKGIVDHNELKYAVLPPKELKSLRLVAGDILIIRSNGSVSLVGRSALVRKEDAGFAYAGYLIRIRPRPTVVDPRFLNLVLGSYDVRLQIELEARSTSGVNNINSEEVRSLRFLLPELDEQREILERTEDMFKLADRLEARYEKARAQVDKLTQATLAKAFCGELVPTEAELAKAEGRSYETAEQLLARVQNARAVGTNGSPSTRGPVRKKRARA